MNVRICSLKGQLSPEFVLLSVCCLLFSFLSFFLALLLPLHHSKNSKSPLLVRLTADSTANWSKDPPTPPPPPPPPWLHSVFIKSALLCSRLHGNKFPLSGCIDPHACRKSCYCAIFFLMLLHLCLPPTVWSHGYIYIYLCGVSGLSEWAQHLMIARWGS